MKRYMVIEQFAPGAKEKIYERFRQKGRMLPDGLVYIDSWLEANGDRCFQLMETNDPGLFERWTDCWKDLVSLRLWRSSRESIDQPRMDANKREWGKQEDCGCRGETYFNSR